MTKIIGNTTATPNPRPDWAQTDETKADFIKNKPIDSGEGVASLIQTVAPGKAKNNAYHRSDIAFGQGNNSYQAFSTNFGANNQTGMTEDEFNAYYWDASYNVNGKVPANVKPVGSNEANELSRGLLHNSKGTNANGKILDFNGYTYEDSQTFSITSGLGNKNKTWSSAVFGYGNNVEGKLQIVNGSLNIVSGGRNIVNGEENIVSDIDQLVLGLKNIVSGQSNIVNGVENSMSGVYISVIGRGNTVNGNNNYIHGEDNNSTGDNNTLLGRFLIANDNNQTIVGEFNKVNKDAIFIVANGIGQDSDRSNAFEVLADGRAVFNGAVQATSLDVTGGIKANGISSFATDIEVKRALYCPHIYKGENASENVVLSKGEIEASITKNIVTDAEIDALFA